ncbi:MAG: hypothetical protein EOP10_02610 [Proteobacteria bacterium]|nr:MAG: hypothetical protein EOP10_02610 [Pseudomonadota bacterium]
MQRLIINTYYTFQFLLTVLCLVQIELALAGLVDLVQFELWWLQAIKSSLVVGFVLTLDQRSRLSTLLYLPQLSLDISFLVSPSPTFDLLILGLGVSQLIFVILRLRRLDRSLNSFSSDVQSPYRPGWFRNWNRSCIGEIGESI